MILNIPENRKVVTEYLENLDEDTFIDEFVIPFFSSEGYYLYRINTHGTGEHGKDLIFYRHIPRFYDDEYLVVQAKSEKLTTSNVEKSNQQIQRALKLPFPAKSAGRELYAHYAVFINSKKHTNDADYEFHKLIRETPYIKILSQENVCELIMKTGIAPKHLLDRVSKGSPTTQSDEDKLVYETILENAPGEIDKLLDHRLKFMKDNLDAKTKELVINYIYDRWQNNRSWEGTVKPMEWFDMYFEFFTERQSEYFLAIFDELTSSTPSFKARQYTISVVKKITPELLVPIVEQFIKYCAEISSSFTREGGDILIKKLEEFMDSSLVEDQRLIDNAAKIFELEESKKVGGEGYKALAQEVFEIAYPEFA